MKYNLNDKVLTQNMDGKYNNVLGAIIEIHPDIDIEPVYTVKYDAPFGSCAKGMFKESDLKLLNIKKDNVSRGNQMDYNQNYMYNLMINMWENELDSDAVEGVSDFENWCGDNIENEEQKGLLMELKEHVDAITLLLHGKRK